MPKPKHFTIEHQLNDTKEAKELESVINEIRDCTAGRAVKIDPQLTAGMCRISCDEHPDGNVQSLEDEIKWFKLTADLETSGLDKFITGIKQSAKFTSNNRTWHANHPMAVKLFQQLDRDREEGIDLEKPEGMGPMPWEQFTKE